jgi:peroxin-10
MAELLYYTLTTGTGLQTLGEEYCDVLQVTGRRSCGAGWRRRRRPGWRGAAAAGRQFL